MNDCFLGLIGPGQERLIAERCAILEGIAEEANGMRPVPGDLPSLMIEGARWLIRMELIDGREEGRVEELMADFACLVTLPSEGVAGSAGMSLRS
jgi:hypothetical protein